MCCEETLSEILQRYAVYNQHAPSYTWKWHGKSLDMNRTLQENGIADEGAEFHKLAIDEDKHMPELQLYYNDDLTES